MSTKSIPTLTLDGARIALAAAEQRSKEINVPMNIAIMDNACHLLAFARMEGAKLTSINIAIDKAFTAAGHRAPTSVYKDNVYPGGPAYGINHSNQGRFMTIAGGVPIVKDGVVVGAVVEMGTVVVGAVVEIGFGVVVVVEGTGLVVVGATVVVAVDGGALLGTFIARPRLLLLLEVTVTVAVAVTVIDSN